jgi:hypothetical protein
MPEATETRQQPASADDAAPPAEPGSAGLPGEEPSGQVGPGHRTGWQLWRPSLIHGTATWLTGLVIYLAVTAVAWMPFENLTSKAGNPPGSLYELVRHWERWDTSWYLIIADSGYTYDQRSAAFFPLYPMTVRVANVLLPGDTLMAALLVSVLSCLVALIMVHRLTEEMMGPGDARRATFYLLAFPTGFYLMAAYTESLFVALAVASLYCMRRSLWWPAGLLAGYASATRMAGVMLGAAFVFEYLRQGGFSWRGFAWRSSGPRLPVPRITWPRLRWDGLALLLVPVGLLCYVAYCYLEFGDPMFFMEQQASWFHYGFQPPWTTIGMTFDMIVQSTDPFSGDTLRNIFNLGTGLLFLTLLTLALVGPWRLGVEYAYLVIFAAIIVLLPMVNPIQAAYPLSSSWRFALECVVVFMMLARLGRNPHFDRAYLAIALSLQGAMVLTFISNNFVA